MSALARAADRQAGPIPGAESPSWAVDLLQPFDALIGLARDQESALRAAEAGASRRQAQLNLLFLLSAMEQLIADHLVRDGFDFGPVRRLLRRLGLPVAPLHAVERLAEGMCSLRALLFDRSLLEALRQVRELALEAASSLASGDAAGAPVRRVEELMLGALPPRLARRRLKVPSCFRAQDLLPEDCFELARRFAVTAGGRDPVLVVGIRTSGSYMAPCVAGWLRANGVEAAYTTMRPKGPFVWAERATVRRHRRRQVLIVDDPPQTGGTFLLTARRLQSAGGVEAARVTLLMPISAAGSLDEVLASEPGLAAFRTIALPSAETRLRRDLEAPEFAEWLAALVGRPGAPARPRLATGDVERQVRRRHLKQVFEIGGYGEVIVKGVGAGWFGAPARLAAVALDGRVPEVLGFRDGLMVTRMLAAPPVVGAATPEMADYVAERARRLSLPAAQRRDGRYKTDGWQRLAKLLARVHGPLAPLRVGGLRRQLASVAAVAPACLVDGQVGRQEWLDAPGGPVKVDFEEHAHDKFDIDCTDPAYDLAGLILELGPRRRVEDEILYRYARQSGDREVADRIRLAQLLYGGIRSEVLSWDVKAGPAEAGWSAAVERWLEAEAALTWTIDRLLADAYPASILRAATAAWSLDVDGVLEDAGLGFPATTPAAAAGLQLMRRAGAAIFLNTGRSLEEVRLRCDALRLDGGVAEYGAVTWDAAAGRAESLLTAADRSALAGVRSAAGQMPGVHLDVRFQHSVRARRLADGVLRELAPEQVAALVGEGRGGITAIQGRRQTDFVAAGHDKARGLRRLLERRAFGGPVYAIGDSHPDLGVGEVAARAFAPRHHDPVLDVCFVRLRQDRQRAVLEAARQAHGRGRSPRRAALPAADAFLVDLLAVRDLPRPIRGALALRPGLLDPFRT